MYKIGKIALCSMGLITAASSEAFCKRRPAPKALLVQLFTNQNKIEYYERKGSLKKIAAEQAKIAETNALIVDDYNKKFAYCPIYYFYDSNAHLVKAHKFDGVLLGKDLKPVDDIVFPVQDTTYFIAYWGTMAVEATPITRPNESPNSQVGVSRASSRTHMVVMTHTYKTLGQVRGKYRMVRRDSDYAVKKANKLYQLTAEKMSDRFIEKFTK